MTINVASLKQVKNAVIGNPSAKRLFAEDEGFVRLLVDALDGQPDIRTEAAHVIASLSYGEPQALSTLLHAGAHHAILHAISSFRPDLPFPLRAAFARALRTLSVSLADLVGPPQWGLPPDYSRVNFRTDAKNALDSFFQTDSLDIFLPLLSSISPLPTGTSSNPLRPGTVTSIAQLLASAVRTDAHRTAIVDWIPPSERAKDSRSNGSRRWEKASATSANSSAKYGGWTVMTLSGLIHSKDAKLQEAALYALAALAKDNPTVALSLAKHSPDKDAPSILSTVLRLARSKLAEIKLAASLCATHICRASAPMSPSSLSTGLPDTCEQTIMHILNRMLNVQADEYMTLHRTRACYVLYYLVHDDQALCLAAYERGCLESLASLIHEITPPDEVEEWGEDEAESLSALRECIRAMSRSVQALRTNLVDSGVGLAVVKLVMRGYDIVDQGELVRVPAEEEEEDRRVLSAALAVVCNCVNDFSPLRTMCHAHGVMARLVQFVEVDDDLRKDALWAIKNLLTSTSTDAKTMMMHALGWGRLVKLFDHPDSRIQEQAFNIVRNLAEDEEGIDLVFQEIGTEVLLAHTRTALESTDDDVAQQAALALANLVNGSDATYTDHISNFSRMLSVLHTCLSDRKTDIRKPVCSVVCELARAGGAQSRKALVDEGFVSTLRRIVEWAGTLHVGSPTGMSVLSASGLGTSPGQLQVLANTYSLRSEFVGGGRSLSTRLPSPLRHHRHMDSDKKLTDMAKLALDWLEHGDSYSRSI
ncbi:hypothetical protein APHAL10511_008556 [Amanita phalloides]|nr:hypothetical protein APHAL10511_008556 [Amanita phalloides]